MLTTNIITIRGALVCLQTFMKFKVRNNKIIFTCSDGLSRTYCKFERNCDGSITKCTVQALPTAFISLVTDFFKNLISWRNNIYAFEGGFLESSATLRWTSAHF